MRDYMKTRPDWLTKSDVMSQVAESKLNAPPI